LESQKRGHSAGFHQRALDAQFALIYAIRPSAQGTIGTVQLLIGAPVLVGPNPLFVYVDLCYRPHLKSPYILIMSQVGRDVNMKT
jgi:hypothetical protein